MTDNLVSEWAEEVLTQCARWNIIFLQLGDAYPAARDEISKRVDSTVPVLKYLEESDLPGQVRLVTDLELLLTPGAPTLGQLRERVIEDRDHGVRVLFLSRRPKIAYPTVPGSQILRDAKLVAPPSYTTDGFLDFGQESRLEGVPDNVIIERALRELGEAACAGLDELLFEDSRSAQNLVSLSESVQEALIGAGMIVTSSGQVHWAIEDGETRVRAALADVIAGMRTPREDLTHVAVDCWVVERLVKQALRARARALWSESWRTELLGRDLSNVALQRAAKGAYPGAERIVDLRDPLEWLSLAEALDLRSHLEIGSLGISNSMWTRLAAELLPVKDRVERSQLIRRDDADMAHRWSEILTQRLTLSGSRSPEDSFALVAASQLEVVTRLRGELSENTRLRGDVEKDVLALVLSTVKFLAHTLDAAPSFTKKLTSDTEFPVEKDLQDSFKAYLDMSDLAGRAAVEVSSIAAGRADVVLYLNHGARYVTEVKRELKDSSRRTLEAKYLPQAVSYQSTNAPMGQLLVLDLTSDRPVERDILNESIWVTHSKDEFGTIVSSTVVAVVRGNRATPSRRKI